MSRRGRHGAEQNRLAVSSRTRAPPVFLPTDSADEPVLCSSIPPNLFGGAATDIQIKTSRAKTEAGCRFQATPFCGQSPLAKKTSGLAPVR